MRCKVRCHVSNLCSSRFVVSTTEMWTLSCFDIWSIDASLTHMRSTSIAQIGSRTVGNGPTPNMQPPETTAHERPSSRKGPNKNEVTREPQEHCQQPLFLATLAPSFQHHTPLPVLQPRVPFPLRLWLRVLVGVLLQPLPRGPLSAPPAGNPSSTEPGGGDLLRRVYAHATLVLRAGLTALLQVRTSSMRPYR